ncbi:MAG: sodium:calcium antiporter, partial [Bacteroidetes bacterium]|nr:sodium:calcium antiporter [Bacteroidota bacterium]
MLINSLLLVVGFFILIKGADIFVDGASSVAGNFKVPKILIGLTIVAFGTSAPEFAVSIKSIISGNHDIVLGNVIGSNILNVLLILGVSSVIKPLVVNDNTVKKELPMMILMMTVFGTVLSDSVFDKGIKNNFLRTDGIVVLLFFSVFIYYLVKMALRSRKNDELEKEEIMPLGKSIFYTIFGI